jgi:hypothetical protein
MNQTQIDELVEAAAEVLEGYQLEYPDSETATRLREALKAFGKIVPSVYE